MGKSVSCRIPPKGAGLPFWMASCYPQRSGKLFSLAAIFLIPDKHFPKKGMEKSWAGETKNGR